MFWFVLLLQEWSWSFLNMPIGQLHACFWKLFIFNSHLCRTLLGFLFLLSFISALEIMHISSLSVKICSPTHQSLYIIVCHLFAVQKFLFWFSTICLFFVFVESATVVILLKISLHSISCWVLHTFSLTYFIILVTMNLKLKKEMFSI